MNNTGVIFRRTLYDNRRGILWWGLGIGVVAFYVVVVYPMIEGLTEIRTLMESPAFQFIIGDIGEIDYTSPTGFLGIEFFTWVPLILGVYAVLFGINITGGEEARGTVDILLSAPVRRWQVIIEKFLAYLTALLGILAISTIGIVIGAVMTPALEISMGSLVLGMLNTLPTLLLIAALALFLTTILSTPGQAGGIAAAIIVASYFLNSLASMAASPLINRLQDLSFFKYYAPFEVLSRGIQWGNFLGLLAAGGILLLLAIVFYQRRDIYV
ncbi:MAG: ABC transporter permease subunit [Anaerolineae bacterium]|nr:ABC transporter permease subunit [Anaerolineae bacterium]